MVEFAITLGVFLLLVLGTMDFGYLYSTKMTLQNAVRQAGRYAITGQCITGSNGTCSKNRHDSIIQNVVDYSLGLVSPSQITLTCTDKGGGCINAAGGPTDIITITVNYPYKFLTGPIGAFFTNGTYMITVSSSFQNEFFPPGQS